MSDIGYGIQVFVGSITFKRYFEEGPTDKEIGKIKKRA